MTGCYSKYQNGFMYDGGLFHETVKTGYSSGIVEARKRAHTWIRNHKRGVVKIARELVCAEVFQYDGKIVVCDYSDGKYYHLNRDGTLGAFIKAVY